MTKRHLARSAALSEANAALTRHLGLIAEVKRHCFTNNTSKDKFLYMMSIPMFYSAWEGYFRISFSICLRRACLVGKKAGAYPKEYITLWLQRENFIPTFYKALLNSVDLSVQQKPINGARFQALTDFHERLRRWLSAPVNHATNFDKLVMTYSNVNGDVAQMNALAIGLDLSAVNFSPLNELLGRRNDISHGGLINPVEEDDATRMAMETEVLINAFHRAVEIWIRNN